MKVVLKDGTVYPHGLALDYKDGGKAELIYHEKVKAASNLRKDVVDRYQFIVKTIEIDTDELVSVSDFSHD